MVVGFTWVGFEGEGVGGAKVLTIIKTYQFIFIIVHNIHVTYQHFNIIHTDIYLYFQYWFEIIQYHLY